MADHDNMLKAKDLIRSKEYDKARKILQRTKHPKAATWLAEIDRRYPPKRTPLWRQLLTVAMVIVIALGVMFSVAVLIGTVRGTQAVTDLRLKFALEDVCKRVYEDAYFDDLLTVDQYIYGCEQEVEHGLDLYEDDVRLCYDRSEGGALQTTFMECLADTGFKFSGLYIWTYESENDE